MIRSGKRAALVALLLLLAPLPAAAQEACRIPDSLQPAPCSRREAARGAPGDFDHYVLAFSWSPAFCASDAGRGRTGQCRDNAFGWVVHGLWPQYAGRRQAREPWPQYCAPDRPLPGVLLRRHFCTMPDQQLMQCQWAKHGSCSGLDAEAYFAAIAALRQRFALPHPEPDSMPSARLRAAVLAAYPGLESRHLRIIRREGRIRELRICLDRSLRAPVDCRS